MGRRSTKEGINKGPWTAIEDKILTDYIKTHGEGKWGNIPRKSELNRCGKSCRLRWLNYLRPDIKRGNISQDEEDLILRLHKLLGNRWSLIAGRLPGRTDNEIKNYWNTYLSRKANVQGNKRQPKNTKTQQKSKTTSPASGLTSNATDALFSTPHKRQQQQQQKQQQQQQQQHPDEPHAINDMDFSQPFPDTNWVVGCAAEKSQSGDHRSESILIAKEDGNSSEFVTTDLSFGDISLSDFLDSDLAKLSGLDSYNMNMIDIMRGLEGDATTSTAAVIGGQKSDLLPLSSPDQAFLTAEWSGSTGPSGVRPNVLDSDFGSLVSVMSANTCPDFWYFY